MRAWEQNIRTVVPYVPGEQPQNADIIKLNTNENPYPPAPGVSRALETLDPDLLRRYPDPAAADLTAGRGGGAVSAFTAGDLSIKGRGAAEAASLAQGLRRTAEGLMAPYVETEDFCFKGVRG